MKVAIKGKTFRRATLINIIAGLLDSTKGNLIVDDVPINKKNKKKWQENIAIVPQSIYLNDSSILENITLGFDQNKIDKDRLFEILEICDLKSFVEQLPNNIYEKVGEKGDNISGGQTRIGLQGHYIGYQ